jgi:hypothetical protein
VKRWFQDDMFEANFEFEDKAYRIPKMSNLEEVLDYVDALPSYEGGKVFGLSALAKDR